MLLDSGSLRRHPLLNGSERPDVGELGVDVIITSDSVCGFRPIKDSSHPPVAANRERIALYVPSYEAGGVERTMVNLAIGLAALDRPVDLLVRFDATQYLDALPLSVRVLHTGTEKEAPAKMAQYLRAERPMIAMAAKSEDAPGLLQARTEARVDVPLLFCVTTHQSSVLNRRLPPRRWVERWRLARLYRRADAIAAVSQGVADDLAQIAGLPAGAIHVLPNPVLGQHIEELARQPITHEWFIRKDEPVLLSVGRFTRQKDYPTLVHAFARLAKKRPCRLVMFGEGRQQRRVRAVIEGYGLQARVDMPGFVANPFPYFARADLFVLSSRWEGLPTVLIEALALGCPVVSTDCPSGPREILRNGRYGALVPPGDVPALAGAMEQVLHDRPSAEFLREAVTPFRIENSVRRYLEFFEKIGRRMS